MALSRIFREHDATLAPLAGKTIAILGYGNQGRAQALNLRDSGQEVIVGNADDAYAAEARADGFTSIPLAQATALGDIVISLLPDEVTPAIYNESIRPNLRPGITLVFASGYCVCYHLIEFPPDINVVLVAPRTMGALVREHYQHGRGFLSFVDVHQDANGQAWPITLALAKGIGSLRKYAMHGTFQHETELDLFTEAALVPALSAAITTASEVLIEAGYPKAEALLEMYLCGEMGDILTEASKRGWVAQTELHSPTSRWATRSHLVDFATDDLRARMRRILAEVRSGDLDRGWRAEQAAGYPRFQQLAQAQRDSLFGRTEREVIDDLDRATRANPATAGD